MLHVEVELNAGRRVAQEVSSVLRSQLRNFSDAEGVPVRPDVGVGLGVGVWSYCRQSEDLLLERLLLVVADPGRHSYVWVGGKATF